jgi:fructokinase
VTLDAICFGEALWDMHERSPGMFERHVGGASANVAIALARLGLRAGVVAGIGADDFGDALVAAMRDDGVETRFVKRFAKRTAVTFITRDSRGEPRFHNYREGSADAAFGAEHVARPAAAARAIVIGTATPASESLVDATHALLDHAARSNALVVVDLNARPKLWRDARAMRDAALRIVARAHVVKASADDAALLRRRDEGGIWVLTSGAGAARALGSQLDVRVDAKRARCVDATGAGDAFLAGVVAALLAQGARAGSSALGDPAVWTNALAVGHDLGAKAVSRVGAAAGLGALGAVRKRLDAMRRRSA